MPMYGQSFTLASADNHGLNAPAPRKGMQGQFTRAAGFLAYNEICSKLNTWTIVHHDKESLGPYAHEGNQWVGYDDVDMIRRKSEFVKQNNYGGAMIWALDLDDFNNVCNCEQYPLLRTINRVLRSYPTPAPTCSPQNYLAKPYLHFKPAATAAALSSSSPMYYHPYSILFKAQSQFASPPAYPIPLRHIHFYK